MSLPGITITKVSWKSCTCKWRDAEHTFQYPTRPPLNMLPLRTHPEKITLLQCLHRRIQHQDTRARPLTPLRLFLAQRPISLRPQPIKSQRFRVLDLFLPLSPLLLRFQFSSRHPLLQHKRRQSSKLVLPFSCLFPPPFFFRKQLIEKRKSGWVLRSRCLRVKSSGFVAPDELGVIGFAGTLLLLPPLLLREAS